MSRRDALNDDQREEIWRLHVKRVSQREIADRIGCNRNTVSAVVRRITEQLAEGRRTELEAARNEALAVYNEVQREAWQRLEQCPPNQQPRRRLPLRHCRFTPAAGPPPGSREADRQSHAGVPDAHRRAHESANTPTTH